MRSDGGLLDLPLGLPKPIGGKGGATNPELFAAGYAACFENAMIHATRNRTAKVKDDDIVVIAEVALSPNGSGGFVLSVTLDVAIIGLDQATAEEVVQAAHARCPVIRTR